MDASNMSRVSVRLGEETEEPVLLARVPVIGEYIDIKGERLRVKEVTLTAFDEESPPTDAPTVATVQAEVVRAKLPPNARFIE